MPQKHVVHNWPSAQELLGSAWHWGLGLRPKDPTANGGWMSRGSCGAEPGLWGCHHPTDGDAVALGGFWCPHPWRMWGRGSPGPAVPPLWGFCAPPPPLGCWSLHPNGAQGDVGAGTPPILGSDVPRGRRLCNATHWDRCHPHCHRPNVPRWHWGAQAAQWGGRGAQLLSVGPGLEGCATAELGAFVGLGFFGGALGSRAALPPF